MVTWSRPFLPSSNRLRVKMSVYLIKMKLKGCPNTIWRDLFDNMFYPESEPQTYVICTVEKKFNIFFNLYDSTHYISHIISFYSPSNSLYFEEPMFWEPWKRIMGYFWHQIHGTNENLQSGMPGKMYSFWQMKENLLIYICFIKSKGLLLCVLEKTTSKNKQHREQRDLLKI